MVTDPLFCTTCTGKTMLFAYLRTRKQNGQNELRTLHYAAFETHSSSGSITALTCRGDDVEELHHQPGDTLLGCNEPVHLQHQVEVCSANWCDITGTCTFLLPNRLFCPRSVLRLLPLCSPCIWERAEQVTCLHLKEDPWNCCTYVEAAGKQAASVRRGVVLFHLVCFSFCAVSCGPLHKHRLQRERNLFKTTVTKGPFCMASSYLC